ncbi:UNVERIFIED_CONTAM: hypothetical protein RMT77_000952 [Armadillidium vulgare]
MKTFLVTLLYGLCFLANGAIIVKIDLPQCTLNSYTLKCDFGFTDDEVIYDSQLQDIVRNDVRIVQILNVNKLSIPRPVCVDTHFRDVRNIEFKSDETCKSSEVSFQFHNSVANLVPRMVKRLDLQESEIGIINCDLGLHRLLISKSRVSLLNSPWPVGGNLHLQIHNSYINKIKALNLQNGMLLHITNTTIDLIEKEAIILGKGVIAILTESIIKSGDKGFLVRVGGRVMLHNTMGKFSIMAPDSDKDYNYEKTVPGVPSKVVISSDESDDENELKSKSKCEAPPYWHWLIPTVVASLEALVLIKMCGDRIPKKKKLNINADPEETALTNKPNLSPNSTFSYYNESFKINPSLNRRKNN